MKKGGVRVPQKSWKGKRSTRCADRKDIGVLGASTPRTPKCEK